METTGAVAEARVTPRTRVNSNAETTTMAFAWRLTYLSLSLALVPADPGLVADPLTEALGPVYLSRLLEHPLAPPWGNPVRKAGFIGTDTDHNVKETGACIFSLGELW